MTEKFQSMREIGQMVGATSHKVGRVLTDQGYRCDGKPTAKAFHEGMVTDRGSTNPGTYFYVWDVKKTLPLLEAAGYQQVSNA